jgi:hypothetical protein
MSRFLLAALALAAPTAAFADAIPFLPAGTDAVLVVQSRKVSETDLMKKVGGDLLKTAFRASRQAQVAVEASGLDPFKDFDRVTIGIDLDEKETPKPFALLEGKFDPKAVDGSVLAYAKENPGKVEAITVGGRAAYKVPGGKPTETMYTAVLDETKLVIAPTEKDLEGAFAAAAGPRSPVIGRELATLLANAKPTAPIFLWAYVKGKFKDVDLGEPKLNARVQGVDWITGAVAVSKDVAITVTANTTDAAAAKQLSDLAGASIGFLKLTLTAAADEQPQLKPVLALIRSARVSPSGKLIVATGSVKGDVIQKAFDPTAAPKKKK